MKKITWIKVLKNLALLAFVVTPVFFVLVWIQALFQQASGVTDLGYVLETGGVYYLSNLIPVLVGGIIHQLLLLVLPGEWTNTRIRSIAFLLAFVIPITVWLSWGGPVSSFLNFAVPMSLALVIYVLLIRIPLSSSSASIQE